MSLPAAVYTRVEDLPDDFSTDTLDPMADPAGVLLCPPRYFDVIDVKNPFMLGRKGTVDRAEAMRQWLDMRTAFQQAGAQTAELDPLAGAEDMVFCANPAFLGVDSRGRKVCAPSRMNHPSRRAEVDSVVSWCRAHGYQIAELGNAALRFEGGGDAIWHPRRRLIWGGHPHRSDPEIYPALAAAFDTPVFAVELTNQTYYHLDTCFCPIDDRTVLVHMPALSNDALRLVRRAFERVIDVSAEDAGSFACNAAPFFGRTVVMDRRAVDTIHRLRDLGYSVSGIDTGEFIKSGGSAYCMKCSLY